MKESLGVKCFQTIQSGREEPVAVWEEREMTESPKQIRSYRTVCLRCRIGYFVSNDMPEPDRFCTNCGYREPKAGEAIIDFTKLFGR